MVQESPEFEHTHGSGLSVEDAKAWLDDMIARSSGLPPMRIEVDQSLHDGGLSGSYRDIPIAVFQAFREPGTVRLIVDAT